ncbi:MAG: PTPA-CTERM sorting domain-containing protein [Synechococcales bacterium]|nr:PTPA-CTERM sorting domain-containing protein [Synechococcales bacterium]
MTMNLTLMGVAAIVAMGTVSVTAPAQAFTISAEAPGTFFSTVPGTTTVDFETGLPGNYAGGGVVSGSLAGQYAQPLNDATRYLTLGGSNEPSPVTINLASLHDYFGLYWGSIDRYNSIEFFSGGTSVGAFTGAVVAGATGLTADGGQFSNASNRYVNFFAGAGEAFDRIVLTSTSPAFESDNHAFRQVPTPALLPGLIGLGAGLWRKRRQSGKVTG